jgi:hypothetical protein
MDPIPKIAHHIYKNPNPGPLLIPSISVRDTQLDIPNNQAKFNSLIGNSFSFFCGTHILMCLTINSILDAVKIW